MHEAREAIIDRLARDLPTNIDLERFLNVVVSELGRMMQADRCDLLQLTSESELRISHEWRKDEKIPSSEGTTIPFDAEKLTEIFRYFQTDSPSTTLPKPKDATLRFFTKALETKSLLIVPIILSGKVLGLLGLHDTHAPREWLDEEVRFSRINRPPACHRLSIHESLCRAGTGNETHQRASGNCQYTQFTFGFQGCFREGFGTRRRTGRRGLRRARRA